MGVVIICILVFTVFFGLFRLCIFILICFVCTSVRILPPSDNSIAVNNNNNNNKHGIAWDRPRA